MEARLCRPWKGVTTIVALWFCCSPATAQFARPPGGTAHSQNFIVFAASPEWAQKVAATAEKNRQELALYWLGHELPAWQERIPLHVVSGPNLGAGGETRFSLLGDRVGNWMMTVQGTEERILDSVLPHEITHTIFATHFAPLGKYVPRWADEGACTTVEHESEKRKHRHYLNEFLRTGRGLAFNQMFRLKEYPQDILPLYAQGHSAVQFLIDQGGPKKFIEFIEHGMRTDNWNASVNRFYAYDSIGQFQTQWNQWLRDGSPDDIVAYAPSLAAAASLASTDGASSGSVQLASNTTPAPAQELAPESSLPGDPISLAAGTGNSLASQTRVQTFANQSWYKRRLEEVSQGGSAVPAEPSGSAPTAAARNEDAQIDALNNELPAMASALPESTDEHYPLRPYQAASRPRAPQSPEVQVLDWGDSVPIPGVAAGGSPARQAQRGNQLVPIR